MIVIGNDPGITGAIAVVSEYKIWAIKDMPTMAKSNGKGNQVNASALSDIIRGVQMIDLAIVEAVTAMPGQGVTSVFSFGRSLGAIEGVLSALGIPYSLVHSTRWKKAAGLTGKDKDAARAKVIIEHPEIADQLTGKKDIGGADAILLAEYGLNH